MHRGCFFCLHVVQTHEFRFRLLISHITVTVYLVNFFYYASFVCMRFVNMFSVLCVLLYHIKYFTATQY